MRLSPACFPVPILGCDPSDEFRQFVPSPGRAQGDAAVAVEGQRHTISLTEAGLLGVSPTHFFAAPADFGRLIKLASNWYAPSVPAGS